jgi:glycine betaine/proline transport system substrate-binding protein
VGALLRNLEMTLADESELMALVLDDKLEPEKAADQWLKRHPEKLEAWLKGTQSTTGAPGLAAVRQSLGLR